MKNHIRYITTIACIFLTLGVLEGAHNAPNNKRYKFLRITIPKSGTHLLEKCIRLMYKKNTTPPKEDPPKNGTGKPKKCVKISSTQFLKDQEKRRKGPKNGFQPPGSVHLAYTADREKFAKKCAHATLLLIRDPRDQIVSFTKFACDKSKYGTSDFNDMLLDFIDGKQRKDVYSMKQHIHSDAMWSFGVAEYYKLFLPWMAVDNVYTVHFENLVGAEGGGSTQAQMQELLNIAHHLNIKLSPAKLEYISRNLFGGTSTFSKGQIGSWKKYFTEEHKQAFKIAAGQLLIDLGYETDINW